MKFRKTFYTILFFAGLILMYLEILIYRKTIISKYIPLGIILCVGVFTYFIDRNNYKKTYFLDGEFFAIMHSFVSWGFITCSLMAVNYYFSSSSHEEYNFKIERKSSLSGSKGQSERRFPIVNIKYFKTEKELVFDYEDTEKINKSDSIKV
jgi:hypothetical protein